MLLYFFPLVVISTTPFFALLPYFLMAALPFKTFTDSISSGFNLSTSAFFASIPSILYRASPLSLSVYFDESSFLGIESKRFPTIK